MGFSRQEYWSGLPFPSPGIFSSQEMNPGLLHGRQILYRLSYVESPLYIWEDQNKGNSDMLKWVCLEKGGSGEHLNQENTIELISKEYSFYSLDFLSLPVKSIRAEHTSVAIIFQSVTTGSDTQKQSSLSTGSQRVVTSMVHIRCEKVSGMEKEQNMWNEERNSFWDFALCHSRLHNLWTAGKFPFHRKRMTS